MSRVYFDYNATAPLHPDVREVMLAAWDAPLNASSVHRAGQSAHKMLEDARATLAELISVFPKEIIFCASATEANNWAMRAFPDRRRLISAVEHPSVLWAADAVIPVDGQGVVKLAALEEMLAGGTSALVSVMLANNETGVTQPVAEVARLCAAHGAVFHCDAVQGLGRMAVDAGLIGADLLTLSGHKCGGPVGAATLVARGKWALGLPKQLHGGGQELRRRAGTENVAAIAGFAKAATLFDASEWARLRGLRDGLEAALDGAVIFGQDAPRLPNTSCFAVEGMRAETLLMQMDMAGFAVSAGSACSSGRIEASPVLTAMGAGELAGAALRVSLGWATTEDEVARFGAMWRERFVFKEGSPPSRG